MAGKSATLSIRIVSDASKASEGFAEAESKVGGFQQGLDKASVAAAGVLAGVGAVAKAAYDSASALEQSSGAVESVFQDQAAAVQAYAKDAAQSLGLSANAYQESAALIGSQLQTLGFDLDQAADKTHDLMGVGADLAATFGGTTEEAVSALSSALKGERDPIEKYGVALSQAAIDAKVAALGLDTSTDASKRNANAQAALALISEQTANAQGAFSREAGTAAGQTQRAAAEFENAKAALGEVLLPIVTEAAQKFSELTAFMVENKDAVTLVVAIVSGLAVGIIAVNGAIKAYRAIAAVATAAQWAWNAAMSMNPIMLVVLAIAAVVAGVVLAYQKFEGFRDVVNTVGRVLKSAFEGAKSVIKWVIDKVEWLMKNSPAGLLVRAFTAPAMAPAQAGGPMAGVYGAAGGPAPLYGAPLSALAGGGSTAGQGSPRGDATMTVNVTINGAMDPVATGRALEKVLRDYGTATGRRVALTVGGRS